MNEEERMIEVMWFWGHVAQLRHRYAGTVNSGGRSVNANKDVDGHPQSLHIWDLAADLYFDTAGQCSQFVEDCKALGMGGYVRESGTSCHVQRWPVGKGPRPFSYEVQ